MNIAQELTQIRLGVQQIQRDVQSIPELADLLSIQTRLIDNSLRSISKAVTSQSEQIDSIEKQVEQLLALLTPKPAVSAVGSVIARNPQGVSFAENEDDMRKATAYYLNKKLSTKKAASAGADVAIQDDGTALYQVTAVDADGNPTAWPAGATVTLPVVTDPSTVAGAPFWGVAVNTADTTNSSLIGTPQNVTPAPAGALPDTGVGLSATITFPNVAPFSISFPLIDVVAGPANTAVGQVNANNPAS
jgi:hypothetical protein